MIEDLIKGYKPYNEQEVFDKEIMLEFLVKFNNYLSRKNKIGHFTASAWTTNEDMSKILMAYHNIYKSWAWLGGHADGNENLSEVALKEVTEETGVRGLYLPSDELYSLEILATPSHQKNGKYVNGHLHLNATFLVIADENEPLKIAENENSAVDWIAIEDVEAANTEDQMVPIYNKLVKKLK